jgi:gluconate kinase
VGKTTVARLLAERFERCAHVEADAFFRFIAAGRIEPWEPEAHAQNEAVMGAVAVAALAYANAGYFTIVEGILIPGWFYEPVRDSFRAAGHEVATAVLMAPVEVCAERARDRPEHPFAEPAILERIRNQFADLGELAGDVIDVAGRTTAEAADEIAERLSAKT